MSLTEIQPSRVHIYPEFPKIDCSRVSRNFEETIEAPITNAHPSMVDTSPSIRPLANPSFLARSSGFERILDPIIAPNEASRCLLTDSCQDTQLVVN